MQQTQVPIVEAIPINGDPAGYKYAQPQYAQYQQQPVFVAGNQPSNAGQYRGLYIMGVACGCCFLLILIISLAVALSGEADCDVTELGVELRNGSDHVSLIFSSCPSEAAFVAFNNAARRWSDIITSSPITPAILGETVDLKNEGCTENRVLLKEDHALDHLVIVAETLKIDGSGGVLAQAGPCFFDVNALNSALTPVVGVMIFDNADLADLEDDGTLEEVILHEMAHVLGLGTLWEFVGQGGVELSEAEIIANDGLLNEPVFPATGGNFADNTPNFRGSAAVDEFDNGLGGTLVASGVPVEDGKSDDPGDPFFNTAAGEGQGSVDGHWKKTVFETELMTFSISPEDLLHPLSTMSILSMEDLGYGVNVSAADAYVLPVGIRSAEVKGKPGHSLAGDLFTKFTSDPLKRVGMKNLFTVKDIVN